MKKRKIDTGNQLFTRNFTLLILGQMCSLFGNYSLKFALSMYVLEQTGEASVFAGMLALAMAPAILCAPLGGSLAAGLLGTKIGAGQFPLLIEAVGFLILPAGIGFLLPLGTLGQYGILVSAVCSCQFVCSMFSICAISTIQGRTPERMTGKVMACVYTISMCAQPLGQLLYGILFDIFAAQVYWVLIPSGVLICVVGSREGKRKS